MFGSCAKLNGEVAGHATNLAKILAEVGEDVRVGVGVRVGPMEFHLDATRPSINRLSCGVFCGESFMICRVFWTFREHILIFNLSYTCVRLEHSGEGHTSVGVLCVHRDGRLMSSS